MVSCLKKGLTEKDIDDLVHFVRGFEKTPPPRDKTAHPSEQPREADLAKIMNAVRQSR